MSATGPAAAPAAIEATFSEGTATIVISGELDLLTMAFLDEQLTLIIRRRPRRLVFDLARAGFVDCGSARLIASAGQWMPDGRRPLIRQARPIVRRVFELSGLADLCELEDSLCAGQEHMRSVQMSVSVHDVRHALTELGRLRFGEMRVEEAMHQIVETTHAIFSVDGAGLMLADADHHLRNAAVSDDRMSHLEELQLRLQEGPCIAAFGDKVLVGAEDLTTEQRWPQFCSEALTRGVRAVLASPIPYNQDAVGVVAVLSGEQRPWSAEAELALLAFTDLAALLIATMMLGEQQTELAVQLQGALNSRAIIEQAKGVLIGRQGLSAHAAYEQLRAQARAERRKLTAVSAELVRGAVRDETAAG
jgi:anti-anti-sigma factor